MNLRRASILRFALPYLAMAAGLFALGAVAFTFRQDIEASRLAIRAAGGRLAESFSHELRLKEHSVRGMQLMAQGLLAAGQPLDWDPRPFLAPRPVGGTWGLDLPPGRLPGELGEVSGLGTIPGPGDARLRELRTAISLSPLFRTLVSLDPSTPWVYYTSASKFLYMYPRFGPEDFVFAQEILDLEFVKGARPEANPDRGVFWTSVYEDAAGKGSMVTVAAPVYDGEEFLGSVAADVTIERLAWLIRLIDIPFSEVSVISAEGETILDSSVPKEGEPGRQGGELYEYPLGVAGWRLLVSVSRHELYFGSLMRHLPLALLPLAFLAILILAAALGGSLRRVEELSTRDHLTGLLNRRSFDLQSREELARAQRQKHSIGLVIFDIDDFKKYNDSHGHQAGDEVLKKVARRTEELLKRATDRAFRIGGEEFALLVLAEDPGRLQSSMDRIVEGIASLGIAHPAGSHGIVTISMGGAFLGQGGATCVEEAYRRADAALYAAKTSGKNRAKLSDF